MIDFKDRIDTAYGNITSKIIKPLFVANEGERLVSPVESLHSCRAYYDQVLERFPFIVKATLEDLEELIKIGIIKDGPILEIGCGKGLLVKALRDNGKMAYGVDISKMYYPIWKHRSINDLCFVGNAENMPGIKEGFSLVITRAFWDSAFGALGTQGENDPNKILKEIHRVLTSGGIFLSLAELGHERHMTLLCKELGFSKIISEDKDVGYIKLS